MVAVVLVALAVAWGRGDGGSDMVRAAGGRPTTTRGGSGDWAAPLAGATGAGGTNVPGVTTPGVATPPGAAGAAASPPAPGGAPAVGSQDAPNPSAGPSVVSGGPAPGAGGASPGPTAGPVAPTGSVTTVRNQPAATSPTTAAPPATTATTAPPQASEPLPPDVIALICGFARAGGIAPIPRDNPAYSPAIDPDGNGFACE